MRTPAALRASTAACWEIPVNSISTPYFRLVEADNVVRYAAFGQNPEPEPEAEDDDPPPSGATNRNRTDYDWEAIKACYMEGRGPKNVAVLMNVPISTLRGRITRGGWARQRRRA